MTFNRVLFLVSILQIASLANASAQQSAAPLAALQRLEEDSGQVRYIIPATQMPQYVNGLGAEIVPNSSNSADHIRLRGWVPTACSRHLSVRVGNLDSSQPFDASTNTYPVYIEGVALVGADGAVITPEQCFSQHRASGCVLSRNASERNCTPISELFPLDSVALTESGRVALRIESTVLDANTGLPAATTDRELIARYTSRAEIAEQEHEEQFTVLCDAAAEGDRDAIGELSQYAGMLEVAERFTRAANERELATIAATRVTNLDEAEEKAIALSRFGAENPDFADEVGVELMRLASFLDSELNATDDESEAAFTERRLHVMSRVLTTADRDFGVREARQAKDIVTVAQLEHAIANPSFDGRNVNVALRRAAPAIQRMERQAIRERNNAPENRPWTERYLNANRTLSSAQSTAHQNWWQAYSSGQYNSDLESSWRRNNGRSPNASMYEPNSSSSSQAWWSWYR